ncbi:MAG: hypothetical protein IT355_19580 [Gemmatimonadaceae bacterium]|nr:hypothetical protein [Gemmatimonadaceae bacterium]
MTPAHRRSRLAGMLGTALLLLPACTTPRLAPLPNATPPAAQSRPLPVVELPPHRQRIVFSWRLQEAELEIRGEGAARIAAPDSARVDLFVAGGLGSGAAWVIGDQMRLDAPDALRRVLPPPAFLWAALGRFAIPPGRDTLVAWSDSAVTADIGPEPRWRLALRGRRITRLERAQGDRVIDRLERRDDGSLVYFHAPTRRQLTLTITRVDSVAPFDASIWRP